MSGTSVRPEPRLIADLLRKAAGEFKDDGALRLGAALSFYSILSLVPLLFLIVAVAGYVFSDPAVIDDLVARVVDVAGSEVGDSIETLLHTVRDQRAGALSIGALLAAFSASGVFQQVQTVLSIVFDVPAEKRRSGLVGWLVKRSIALVSAIALSILVVTPLAAVGSVRSVAGLLPDTLSWLRPVLHVAIPVLSLLMLMLAVGLALQVLTPVVIPWKAAWRGGAFTAVIGLVAAYGIGEYLTQVGASGTLGALGGLAFLLFFMGWMWAVFLFGAEVTKVYADYLRPGTRAAQTSPGRDPEREKAPATTGTVFAFVAGLAIGWLGRRRD